MNAPDPPHWSQKVMFGCVSYFLGAIGTVSSPYETRFKTGRTGAINAKVRATKSRRNFGNERIRSTPLDPKLMFWCVSSCLGAFGTILSPYEARFKMGRTVEINAKVRAANSRRNFSQ